MTNSINLLYPFVICFFCMWLIFEEMDQSKIRAVAGSFKRKSIVSENWKVILTGHIIHSCSWRIRGRETQQILFTTYCNVWQLLLSGISSIFQTYPSFSIFNLILLDPKSGKIIPLFLSFLFWNWYYPVSFKPRITKQFPFPHELRVGVGVGGKHLESPMPLIPTLLPSPAPALWEGAPGPIDNIFIFHE